MAAVSVLLLQLGPIQARALSGSGAGSGASGTSVEADFNGDTFADLAVGVPQESVGPVNRAGAVNVIYGSPAGLSAKAVPDQLWHQDSSNVGEAAEEGDVIYGSASGLSATATPDQFWHQDSPNVEDAAESLDLFGSALAAIR